jgi:hypothetical protein
MGRMLFVNYNHLVHNELLVYQILLTMCKMVLVI